VGLAAAKPEAFREDGFAANMKKHLNYSINVINIYASLASIRKEDSYATNN
jgi:hypothetical protein